MHVPRFPLAGGCRRAAQRRRQAGFTLIEVMIAVAVVAILASIAVPSYRDYVRRGQLPEAFAALADARVKMEQYYQDNRNYGTGTKCAGDAAWTKAKGKRFEISCALSDAGQGYTVTASGYDGAVAGHVYTIDHNNAQRTTKFKGSAVDKSCWLARGNEC
ncbi:type IV pilin protein [Azohydromonas sediminis]|uniref:type IV pilin protein n=1 Tax=Azohydromonas sediminis TaxID=2259674 RepID=UPI00234FDA1A|nr:type IV pilin protein [Azohydromonas sediminis]